jgi:hypothetical protein
MAGPGAKAIDEVVTSPRVYIRLQSSQDQAVLVSLKQTLDQFQGTTEVVLVLGQATERQAIKLPSGIDSQSEALDRLGELVGSDNIKIQ